MENITKEASIIYLGPIGFELGFSLSGIKTKNCTDGAEIIEVINELKKQGGAGIVLVDEGLASEVLDKIEELQREELISIVLLPHPTEKKSIAAKTMNTLMIRAVGTDIFNK